MSSNLSTQTSLLVPPPGGHSQYLGWSIDFRTRPAALGKETTTASAIKGETAISATGEDFHAANNMITDMIRKRTVAQT